MWFRDQHLVPAIHGTTKATNAGLEIVAGGKDIWGTSDEFRFAHQKQTGDFDVVVSVESLTAPHLYSRAGLMAREDLFTRRPPRFLFGLSRQPAKAR